MGVRRTAQMTARAMMSSGETLVSAKSDEVFSRRTSSIVRVASTSVHTETWGAEYADCTMPEATALRTPRTGIDSSRSPAGSTGRGLATAGAGAAAGAATGIVSSRTAGHSG